MKVFCVRASYYDDGRIEVNVIDSKEASEESVNSFKSDWRCDAYFGWFDSMAEAEAFARKNYKV